MVNIYTLVDVLGIFFFMFFLSLCYALLFWATLSEWALVSFPSRLPSSALWWASICRAFRTSSAWSSSSGWPGWWGSGASSGPSSSSSCAAPLWVRGALWARHYSVTLKLRETYNSRPVSSEAMSCTLAKDTICSPLLAFLRSVEIEKEKSWIVHHWFLFSLLFSSESAN